jgi:hypothetical protein
MRHYTLGTFLRQTPVPMLKEYLKSKSLHLGKREEVEPQSVATAIESLPPNDRARIERDFQDVHILANRAGTVILHGEVELCDVPVADNLEAMENHHHRAMWLLLNRRWNGHDLFGNCTAAARVRRPHSLKIQRCRGLPRQEPSTDEPALQSLAEEIRAFYRGQGRGHKCIVEHYFRSAPKRHCYFAYPEDYTTSELQYEGDVLKRRTRKSIFEVVFIYIPDEGTLEVSAPGGKRELAALQTIFCKTMLRLSGLPERSRQYQFNLDLLKDPDFSFPTDVEDGIEKVEILAMRVNPRNNPRRRIVVEQDPTSHETIYDWINNVLKEENVSMSRMLDRVFVSQVKIRITWYADNGGRPRTLTFTLTLPCTCSLDDSRLHRVVKRYLRRWKIAP